MEKNEEKRGFFSRLFGKGEEKHEFKAEELIVRGDLNGVPHGSYELKGYTGKVKLMGSDCEVSGADITVHVDPCAGAFCGVFPSRWIEWKGGEVRSGNLTCEVWEGGVFHGEVLKIHGEFKGGEFRGSELHADEVSGGVVCYGNAFCGTWNGAAFEGNSLHAEDFNYGVFKGSEFIGTWHDGAFRGGVFNGEWHGGVWEGGEWQGKCCLGDGTFEYVRKK